MKKIVAFLLVITMLFTLAACQGNQHTPSIPANTATDVTGPGTTVTTTPGSGNEGPETTQPDVSDATTPTASDTQPAPETPTGTTESTTPTEPETKPTEPEETTSATTPTEPAPTEPSVPEPCPQTPLQRSLCLRSPLPRSPLPRSLLSQSPAKTKSWATIPKPTTNAKHKELSASQYYQYCSLSQSEKQLYNAILNGILEMKNFIDISSFHLDYNIPLRIFSTVLADHPELFYIVRNPIITYYESDGLALDLIVRYTDGETADVISDDCERVVSTANRSKIASQKATFDEKVRAFIKTIPSDAKDYEKEMVIHNFLCNHIVYDDSTANSYDHQSDLVSHAFSAYGAMVDGKAVCEGYAKLFQWLCYQVGINATQVIGLGNGGPHMWNTVKIQGDWYVMDVTWNDSYVDDTTMHIFYNVTSAFVADSHIPTDTSLSVPQCTATEYHYANIYAINVSDKVKVPKNMETFLAIAAQNTDIRYVVIYFESGKPVSEYFVNTFYIPTSKFQQIIANNGYDIELSQSYFYVDGYVFIPIIGR